MGCHEVVSAMTQVHQMNARLVKAAADETREGSFQASGMAIGDTGGDDDVGTGAGVVLGVRVEVQVGVGVEGGELMGEGVAAASQSPAAELASSYCAAAIIDAQSMELATKTQGVAAALAVMAAISSTAVILVTTIPLIPAFLRFQVPLARLPPQSTQLRIFSSGDIPM
ncbi:unnamed protein product [Sphagnum balticum]